MKPEQTLATQQSRRIYFKKVIVEVVQQLTTVPQLHADGVTRSAPPQKTFNKITHLIRWLQAATRQVRRIMFRFIIIPSEIDYKSRKCSMQEAIRRLSNRINTIKEQKREKAKNPSSISILTRNKVMPTPRTPAKHTQRRKYPQNTRKL